MKVFSLFDGMGCGMIAFRQLGIPVDEYVAYEIDKYAVKVSSHNFPEIKHMGDVFKGDFTQYKGFDWLVGGSPCTYWSIAKTSGRETTASGMGWELFSQYVRALKEAEPKFFLYENNKSMSNDIRESISEAFGFEPIMINSALVSAQTRKRLYWVGIRGDDGKYRRAQIPQPADRGILLRDILDTGEADRGKSHCIIGSAGRTTHREYLGRNQGGMAFEPCKVFQLPTEGGIDNDSQAYRVYDSDGKGRTQCANGGGGGAKTGLYAISVNIGSREAHEVKDGQISIKGKTYPINLPDGFYIIRKLTVNECRKLQTVPDWYDFSVISDTQAYKCLGNGWTVEVIMHLISSALEDGKGEVRIKQSKLAEWGEAA